MRPVSAAVLCASLAFLSASAAKGEDGARTTDRCIDACIATQRDCVIKAVTLADKSKCTKDNAACSTKCPLPNHGSKPSR